MTFVAAVAEGQGSRGSEEQGSANTRFGFAVAALDEIVEKLVAKGGTVLSPPKQSQWGRRAILKDPDGHRVELLECDFEREM